MAHEIHHRHDHEHGPGCGHTAVRHDGHTDYLHDGCLHHPTGNEVEEHRIKVSNRNPAECTPDFDCEHDEEHRHGPACGHEQVPHGDHMDYLVDGRLHHPHGDHCDDHGSVKLA